MTGTPDFNRYQVDVMLDTCIDQVSRYIYTPSNETDTTAVPMSIEDAKLVIAETCVGDCSDQGSCIDGNHLFLFSLHKCVNIVVKLNQL